MDLLGVYTSIGTSLRVVASDVRPEPYERSTDWTKVWRKNRDLGQLPHLRIETATPPSVGQRCSGQGVLSSPVAPGWHRLCTKARSPEQGYSRKEV